MPWGADGAPAALKLSSTSSYIVRFSANLRPSARALTARFFATARPHALPLRQPRLRLLRAVTLAQVCERLAKLARSGGIAVSADADGAHRRSRLRRRGRSQKGGEAYFALAME